jgi:tetrathionate reductase subunit B
MARRLGFVVRQDLCIDCRACMVACSVENGIDPGKHRNWVHTFGPTGTFPDLGMQFRPGNCMHCSNPPCERVCPTGATYRTADGLVEIDQAKCIGCRYCMQACPYDARYFDDRRGVTDKCTACIHRLDAGQEPACVQACMTGSRMFGDLKDPASEVVRVLAQGDSHVLAPEAGTQPGFFYTRG